MEFQKSIKVINNEGNVFVLPGTVTNAEGLLQLFSEHDRNADRAKIGFNANSHSILMKPGDHVLTTTSDLNFAPETGVCRIFILRKDQKGGANRTEMLNKIKQIIAADPTKKAYFNSSLAPGLNYTNAPTATLMEKLLNHDGLKAAAPKNVESDYGAVTLRDILKELLLIKEMITLLKTNKVASISNTKAVDIEEEDDDDDWSEEDEEDEEDEDLEEFRRIKNEWKNIQL